MAQFLSVWIIICVFGVFTVASDGGGLSCNFEPNTHTCEWKNMEGTEDNLDWFLGQGPATLSKNGPYGDHTMRGTTEGHFIYIAPPAGRPQRSNKALLLSPSLSPIAQSLEGCLTFWYYLQGGEAGHLAVYLVDGQSRHGSQVWSVAGQQGAATVWKRASMQLSYTQPFLAVIEGSFTLQEQQENPVVIALDDIAYVSDVSSCLPFAPENARAPTDPLLPIFLQSSRTSFVVPANVDASITRSSETQTTSSASVRTSVSTPMPDSVSCNFESKTESCGWKNVEYAGDTLDWFLQHRTLNVSGTDSPSDCCHNSTKSDHYVCLKSPSKTQPTNTAFLLSPGLPAIPSPQKGCLTFSYYLHGSGVGHLAAYLVIQTSATHYVGLQVWSLDGLSQGGEWQRASVTLNSDQTFFVMFLGNITSSGGAVIAVDDIWYQMDSSCTFLPERAKSPEQARIFLHLLRFSSLEPAACTECSTETNTNNTTGLWLSTASAMTSAAAGKLAQSSSNPTTKLPSTFTSVSPSTVKTSTSTSTSTAEHERPTASQTTSNSPAPNTSGQEETPTVSTRQSASTFTPPSSSGPLPVDMTSLLTKGALTTSVHTESVTSSQTQAIPSATTSTTAQSSVSTPSSSQSAARDVTSTRQHRTGMTSEQSPVPRPTVTLSSQPSSPRGAHSSSSAATPRAMALTSLNTFPPEATRPSPVTSSTASPLTSVDAPQRPKTLTDPSTSATPTQTSASVATLATWGTEPVGLVTSASPRTLRAESSTVLTGQRVEKAGNSILVPAVAGGAGAFVLIAVVVVVVFRHRRRNDRSRPPDHMSPALSNKLYEEVDMTTHDHHSGLGDVEAVNGRDESVSTCAGNTLSADRRSSGVEEWRTSDV